MISAKVRVKKTIASVTSFLGHRGVLDRWRSPMVYRVIPRLLDQRALPAGPAEIRLRHGRTPILCNPYSGPLHTVPYWFGTLYERGTEKVLRELLRPGDTLIDIGANIGHMTFIGADIVGSEGRVYAVEPDSVLTELIEKHARKHGLTCVKVFNTALTDSEGEGVLCGHILSIPGHEGDGRPAEAATEFKPAVSVPFRRADSCFTKEDFRGRVVLKIDVEGHEAEVLRGMGDLLDCVEAAIVEVTPEWIGGLEGVRRLFEFMATHGFRAHIVDQRQARARGEECGPDDLTEQTDVLFEQLPIPPL